MISGNLPTVKLFNKIAVAAIAWLLFALASPIAQADGLQLSQLMHILAQNKSGKATFVEKKYIGILDRPVVSSGDLSFTAPDQLEKRTLTPRPETLILNGDILTIDQPGRQQKMVSLGDHPEVTAFIESIRGTLAGDLCQRPRCWWFRNGFGLLRWIFLLDASTQRAKLTLNW